VSKRCIAWPALSLTALLILVSPSPLGAASAIKGPRDQAAQHEKNFEWDKALAIYESLLREDRSPELQERYNACLRRLWQVLRHQDIGYRKEVLGLDYGQALRLYNKMRDTLLDHSLDRKKADPARLLHKGLEELDAALANPLFCQTHLPGKQLETLAFREYLKRKWGGLSGLSRPQAEKQIREIALAAQDMLRLNPTVTILELACGACYAFDDYTAYLTPSQFRQLCDSLKGQSSEGVVLRSVLVEMKDADIGYIKVLSFQDNTIAELDAALDALDQSGTKALVLDLRGNPGGLLDVAIEAARRFLAAGVIVAVENQDARLSAIYQARAMGPIRAMPMVVLVDGDTASAAEVLAGALKDNDRARLVGQTTFGKGCSQTLVKLPAAGGLPTGGLRVTIARFFSPRGVCYTGRGIVPDLIADRFKPEAPEMDNQLAEAIADLNRQLAMR
jgi:hypothetical protein